MHGIHTAFKDESVEIEKSSQPIKRQLESNFRELEELKQVIFLLDSKLEMVKSQGPVEDIPYLKQTESPCASILTQELQIFEKIIRDSTAQLKLLISKIEL